MTTKTYIAAAIMAFIGLTGFSQTTSQVNADIQMTQDRQIRIWFMNVQNEKIALQVIDAHGNTLNNKTYRCKGNAKLLVETNNLADGIYTISAQSNGVILDAEQIMVSEGQVLAFNQQFDKSNMYLVTK
jgi:4-hydroxyphenylpyruvate dioxygenase-like putative hemolysin